MLPILPISVPNSNFDFGEVVPLISKKWPSGIVKPGISQPKLLGEKMDLIDCRSLVVLGNSHTLAGHPSVWYTALAKTFGELLGEL